MSQTLRMTELKICNMTQREGNLHTMDIQNVSPIQKDALESPQPRPNSAYSYEIRSRAANKKSWSMIREKNYPSVSVGAPVPSVSGLVAGISCGSHGGRVASLISGSLSFDGDIGRMLSGEKRVRLATVGGEAFPHSLSSLSVAASSRTADVISDQLYGTSVEVGTLPRAYGGSSNNVRKETTKQSRRLPPRLWACLSLVLGIRRHSLDHPILGTALHMATVAASLLYIASYLWFKVYDVSSEFTNETALSGTVAIVMVVMWAVMGVYANQLARKLFMSDQFVDNVRLHSKRIIKLNTSVIMMLLLLAVIILNDYDASSWLNEAHCGKRGLSPVVCQIMYGAHVSFSLLTFVWNAVVGCVLLSVCRTHTIGIRRFIRALEEDGRAYEQRARLVRLSGRRPESPGTLAADPYDESGDEDDCTLDESFSNAPPAPGQQNGRFFHDQPLDTGPRRRNPLATYRPDDCNSWMTSSHIAERQLPPPSDSAPHLVPPPPYSTPDTGPGQDGACSRGEDEAVPGDSGIQCETEASETVGAPTPGEQTPEGSADLQMLTNEDILLGYWKISCRIRVTALSLQRWLMAWIIFIVSWNIMYIIYWVRHSAMMVDILLFILPILILPILCSAYGEVNYEGRRMLKCICPTPERIHMLFFLTQQPLEMTAYTYSISYGTVTATLGAIATVFCTNLALSEMKASLRPA